MDNSFTKSNLTQHGGWVEYRAEHLDGAEINRSKFVARFKTGGVGTFMTFLRKNFTVKEYFGLLDGGMSPLDIVESKGYLLPHIKKWLKRGGYPVTPAGFKQSIADMVSKTSAVA
jgi:hypothetical protein